MKKRILAVLLAMVYVCLVMEITSPMFKNAGLVWTSQVGRAGSRDFYFKKRQWLADIRTVIAVFRYLRMARAIAPSSLRDMVNVSNVPPARIEASANLMATNMQGA
jgi:hypothetical protein